MSQSIKPPIMDGHQPSLDIQKPIQTDPAIHQWCDLGQMTYSFSTPVSYGSQSISTWVLQEFTDIKYVMYTTNRTVDKN